MKRPGHLNHRSAYTINETVIAAAVFSLIMGAVVVGTMALQRGFVSVEGFGPNQMHLPDLIAMDARRGYVATPTEDLSDPLVKRYRLPLTILTPAVYNTDGKTMLEPTRKLTSTIVIVKGGKSGKNPHNFKRITYPLSYGTSGNTPTTTVTYTQNGTTVFRTAGGVTRAVATGVQSITFDAPDYDMLNPGAYMLTSHINFVKSAATKADSLVDNLLVSSFLVRGDFYDNDHD